MKFGDRKNISRNLQLTYVETPPRHQRPHDPRAESLSGSETLTRMLCVHKRRCV